MNQQVSDNSKNESLKNDDGNLVSIGYLISFMGVTEQRIGQLVSDGIVIKPSRGLYDLLPSVNNYCAFLRRASRGSDSTDEEKYQRIRLTTAKADMAELEADEKAGDLVRREAVELVNNKVAVTLNVNLIGIADRVASLVAATSSGDECHHLINSEVRKSLDSCLKALSKIEVDDTLLDVTRNSAKAALELHEETYKNFEDPNGDG